MVVFIFEPLCIYIVWPIYETLSLPKLALLFVDVQMGMMFYVNTILLVWYSICFSMIYKHTLCLSLRLLHGKLVKLPKGQVWLWTKLLDRLHEVHGRFYPMYTRLDDKLIRWPYSTGILLAAVYNISSMFGILYNPSTLFLNSHIIFLSFVFHSCAIFTSLWFLYVSNSLTISSKYCVRFMASPNARFNILGVQHLFKLNL